MELGITKVGNGFARRLLVQAAHYILGHFGEDFVVIEGTGATARRSSPFPEIRANRPAPEGRPVWIDE